MTDLITGDAWLKRITTFEREAWKIERQLDYTADEPDAVQRWRDQPGDLAWLRPWMRNWMDTIQRIVSEGKTFQRVRVQTEPLNDYLRWQRVTAPFNLEAGEDIRLLPVSTAEDLGLPAYDFWVFDDDQVVIVHRDDTGTLGGEVVTDPGSVAQHQRWRHLAWAQALPFDQYPHDTS